MTDKPTPTDAELDTLLPMVQLNGEKPAQMVWLTRKDARAFSRAVLAKWGTLRADKIVIPTDTMEQEFQQHYRRGYEAGKKASTPQPTQVQPIAQAAEPVALDHIAAIEDGELRYMTGRKAPAYDCELYAMPDGKRAPVLFTAPQPVAREPVESSEGRWLCLLCKSSREGAHGVLDDSITPCPNGIKGGQHGTE